MSDTQLALTEEDGVITVFHHRAWTYKVKWEEGKPGDPIVLEGPVMDKGGRWRPGLRKAWDQVKAVHSIPAGIRALDSQLKKMVFPFDYSLARGIAFSRFQDHVEADEHVLRWREDAKVYARIEWLLRQLNLSYSLSSDTFSTEIEGLEDLTRARVFSLQSDWDDTFAPWLNLQSFWTNWSGRPCRVARMWSAEHIDADKLGMTEVKWVHGHLAMLSSKLAEIRKQVEAKNEDRQEA